MGASTRLIKGIGRRAEQLAPQQGFKILITRHTNRSKDRLRPSNAR